MVTTETSSEDGFVKHKGSVGFEAGSGRIFFPDGTGGKLLKGTVTTVITASTE